MATITAAAGGGNWTTGGSWVGGVAPTAADDAVINGTSGNITIDSGGAVCRSLNCTGYTGTLTHNASSTLTIGDGTAGSGNVALTLAAGMTYTLSSPTTNTINFISTSATQQTITTAGKTISNWNFNAASNGSWILSDNLTQNSSCTMTLTKGTLNLNGKTLTIGNFNSSNSNVRSLTFGAATVNILGASTPWAFATNTNLTLSAASSTLNFGLATFIQPGGTTWGTINITFPSGGTTTFQQGFTCTTLTVTGSADVSCLFGFAASNTATITGTLTLNGNSTVNRLYVSNQSSGSLNATVSAGTVVASYVDLEQITGTGAGSWNLASITGGSGDCGGNSGITFTTPATQTWNGTSGGNWSANAWSSRIPLPQDPVIINAAFSASQTVTLDMPRGGKNIDWTGATGSPTWTIGSTKSIFGSLTLISGMSITASSNFTLKAKQGTGSTYTLTTAGQTLSTFNIDAYSNTVNLADSLIVSATFSILNGTFDASGFNVTCFFWQNFVGTARTITGGSGTWTFTGTGTIMNTFNNALTQDFSATTIAVTNVSASTKTLVLGGLTTFGNFLISTGASAAAVIFSGAGTLKTIAVTGGSTVTVTFPASTTITLTGSNPLPTGASGNLITLNSSTSGTPATISSSQRVTSDYVSVKDITASNNVPFYAGTHSTNVSGNTNWSFTDPPTYIPGQAFLIF